MTCPACSGRLSRPTLGRRTGRWIQHCFSCWQSQNSVERPEYEAPAPKPERIKKTPVFDSSAAPTARMGRLNPAQLLRANGLDGKLKQIAD